jgi:hypothetical protein
VIEEIVHSAEFLGGKEDSELGQEIAKLKLVEVATLILVVFLEKQDGFNQTKEKKRVRPKTYQEDALALLKAIDALRKELVLDLVTDHR